MPKLGVNIDHVATLRQARREFEPDPIRAARICERAGAHSIVCHLREDRRHINEHDVKKLRKTIKAQLNLEMSMNSKIVRIAAKIKPDQATLVPEKRKELTTEGGLDVISHFQKTKKVVKTLQKRNIAVSLFIDPVKEQILKAKATGATAIELHTGTYARAATKTARTRELNKISRMTRFARTLGLRVNAGHGLNYQNTKAIARIRGIEELNTGHSIIAQAVFIGLEKAVKKMVRLCKAT